MYGISLNYQKVKKPIRCKWVNKTTKDSDGKMEKYKARLVTKKL